MSEQKIFGMNAVSHNGIKQIQETLAKEEEKQILNSIIGSKITGFKIRADKKTKHMYDLEITTDAKEIEIVNHIPINDGAFLLPQNRRRLNPSIIKLRVRI